jgi:hypothetical protein
MECAGPPRRAAHGPESERRPIMGSLYRFNLPALQKSLGLAVFIETGTGNGDSLAHAAEGAFDKLFSIEISPVACKAAQRRFAHDARVEIIGSDSVGGLTRILTELAPTGRPALFWLDAHFPGAPNLATYDAEPNPDLRWPLETEIQLIRRMRPTGRDVIIIDDLRIYIDGPFGRGIAAPVVKSPTRSLDFIIDCFKDTHNYSVMWEDEGYMMLSPRSDR